MTAENIRDAVRRGAQHPGTSYSLMSRLNKNAEGSILGTLANVMMIFAHDSELVGMLAYDEFRSEYRITRPVPLNEDDGSPLPGPYPRSWGPADVALIQGYLQRTWSPKFTVQAVEQGMVAEASLRRFHPILNWIDALRWDGKPRLDTWLHIAFGCDKSEYTSAVGAKFLIAAVRRVRKPGCKFDYLPVLEGGQGIGKSRTCKVLFGEDVFSDSMPNDVGGKDAAMALLGIWGLELGEIDQLIRAEVETVKAFLSRSTDRYRPPYERAYVDRPRQGVLIGTTNAVDYLRDSTGNRRIWPIKCKHADAEWVRVNRDQLWAEAAAREGSGEVIWLDDKAISSKANEEQSVRMSEDVWAHAVQEYISGQPRFYIRNILSGCLDIPKERQTRREEMRVAAILQQLGCTKHHGWNADAKKADRWWQKATSDPIEAAPPLHPVQPLDDLL